MAWSTFPSATRKEVTVNLTCPRSMLKCASKHGQVLGKLVKRTVAPAPNRKFKVAVIYCSMCLDTRC